MFVSHASLFQEVSNAEMVYDPLELHIYLSVFAK